MRLILCAFVVLLAACGDPLDMEMTWTGTTALLPAPISSEGEYEATLLWFAADRDWVESLLPPELELGPQKLTHRHHHPVALLHQTYLSVHPPGQPPSGLQWNELSLYIVHLQLKDGVDCVEGKTGPFSFLPIMHVDSPLPILFGNVPFGLNQHLAAITRTLTDFDVESLDATAPLTYDADFGALEPLTKKGEKRLDLQAAALSAPTFGRRADGTLVWHAVDWMFDAGDIHSLSHAEVEAASPQLGADFAIDTRGVNKSKLGAFRIHAPFESTVPVECPAL